MPRSFRKGRETNTLRVHNYASLHVSSARDLTEELKGLAERRAFSKHAWVNLWDLPSSHQYLLLAGDRRVDLEAAARHHAASTVGVDPHDLAIATAVGQTRKKSSARGPQSKTEVAFFAATLHEIRTRIRPIVEAGFVIEGVTTPCGALWSQAKLRQSTMTGDVHAFVALGSHLSALAIFANGFFLYGRDIGWGYTGTSDGRRTPMDREELADRLSKELRRSFLYLKQYWEPDVSQLLLCGDMPEIRSLTAPLIDRLNIEVETLDTLEGIDPLKLPEPADRFSEHLAAFRLASAIAVQPPPVNLLAPTETAGYMHLVNRRVVAAGLGSAAAIALAVLLYTRGPSDLSGDRGTAARAGGQTATVQHHSTPPSAPATPTNPPASPVTPNTAGPSKAAPSTGPAPSATVASTRTSAGPASPQAAAKTRVATERRAPSMAANTINQRVQDPVVRSILYSESRQVAIVDGHIVKPGDRVGQMFVQAIERDGVILTTRAGLRKRIGLDRPTVRIARQ
jgi:hypothetical protein